MGSWGGWALGGFLGLLTVLIATNGVLTWLVSRSVMRPLSLLEAAARRLGAGDLEPGPLPNSPPEFRRVGLAFDDLRQRLKDSLGERQALEEERRTWVASVSHDLRTPLAVIRGYAEGLRDGLASTPDKQTRYQAVILDRARQMERQIDDLFQWARWDWGQPKLNLQPLDLGEELRHAVTTWATDWPRLEVSLVVSEGPWPLDADAMALRRIFDNLVRNVVQHAGTSLRLHLGLSTLVRHYAVEFRDEGPGLAPDILPRVFERFYRGDPARNPAQGGGGLGLTIAQTLSRSLGGDLLAANHPEGGAVFTLTLPRAAWDGAS
jgi:signal transduction histidine kinase